MRFMLLIGWVSIALHALPSFRIHVDALTTTQPRIYPTNYGISKVALNAEKKEDNAPDEEVKVGSKDYYAGFLSRDLNETEDRVAGDKVLIPTLKFVGGFSVLIVFLLFGFMASNGLV